MAQPASLTDYPIHQIQQITEKTLEFYNVNKNLINVNNSPLNPITLPPNEYVHDIPHQVQQHHRPNKSNQHDTKSHQLSKATNGFQQNSSQAPRITAQNGMLSPPGTNSTSP